MTTHLGTLHGEGTLLGPEGRRLGQVIYEIDGYVDHGTKSANGQIEAWRGTDEIAASLWHQPLLRTMKPACRPFGRGAR
jgi:hypothetical protein